jgi:hypothetical protein
MARIDYFNDPDAPEGLDPFQTLYNQIADDMLTYRETLVLVAYLITGGLTCTDVEGRHRDKRRRETLKSFGLLNLLFDAPLSEDQAEVQVVTLHRLLVVVVVVALRALRVDVRVDPERAPRARPTEQSEGLEADVPAELGDEHLDEIGIAGVGPAAGRDVDRHLRLGVEPEGTQLPVRGLALPGSRGVSSRAATRPQGDRQDREGLEAPGRCGGRARTIPPRSPRAPGCRTPGPHWTKSGR